jgi:hypothetical protein
MPGQVRHRSVAAHPASDRARLRALRCARTHIPERTTMNTSKWRGLAVYWRHLSSVVLSGEAREHSAHPPDLFRSTALYERFLR